MKAGTVNARRCRATILISGSGSNLQAMIDAVADQHLDLDIVLVLSNRGDAYGLERAARAGIETVCLPHASFADREAFDRAVAEQLSARHSDLVILAGFMRILSPWFVERFEGRVLNIHPALLPRYPGLDTHQRVLDSGDPWHGATVHFVTTELDGGPRILQGRLRTRDGESAEELARRVLAVEHRIYPEAVSWFASGRLEMRDGSARLDGRILDEPVVRTFDE